jgi:hypothetical protein
VRDTLEEISIGEKLPSLSVGIVTRAAAPLGRAQAAMARAFSAVARTLPSQ